MATKECRRCRQPKDLSLFSLDKAKKDGFRAYCRPCVKDVYTLNREETLKKRRGAYIPWCDVDPQEKARTNERRRAWRKANPGLALKKSRQSYQRNKESFLAATRRYAAKNPEKKIEADRLRRERLARAPGGPFSLERYKGRFELYGGLCAYCGVQKATEADHQIPVSRGGGNWPSNILPSCQKCNASKNRKKHRFEWTVAEASWNA